MSIRSILIYFLIADLREVDGSYLFFDTDLKKSVRFLHQSLPQRPSTIERICYGGVFLNLLSVKSGD
jgi:hypothetical protein